MRHFSLPASLQVLIVCVLGLCDLTLYALGYESVITHNQWSQGVIEISLDPGGSSTSTDQGIGLVFDYGTHPCPTDINVDGATNTRDLLLLPVNFGWSMANDLIDDMEKAASTCSHRFRTTTSQTHIFTCSPIFLPKEVANRTLPPFETS